VNPFHINTRIRNYALVLILGAFFLNPGCSSKKKANPSLRKEVRESLAKISLSIKDSLAMGDRKGIDTKLNSFYPGGGENPPFGVGVLNREGVILSSIHCERAHVSKMDFSRYRTVKEALEKGKITQGKFYFQNGPPSYVIISPVSREKKVLGALILVFDPKIVEKRWGIGEKEFISSDFN